MAIVRLEAELSAEQLLEAVGQLSPPELQVFVQRVLALQAQRRAPSLPESEADLLLKVHRGIPRDLQDRYNALITKRRAENLTPDEHKELLRLTDEVEQLEVQRIEVLAQLARLRGTSLPELMSSMGIHPPEHG